MAGIDAEASTARPKQALAAPDGAGRGAVEPPEGEWPMMETRELDDARDTTGLPAALAAVPPDRVVDLDVRDQLRRGEEPFSRIMAARRSLPDGGVLRVRAIFEPVPLYAVMARQGLAHWTEQLGEEDWRVWFYAKEEAPAGAEPGDAARGPVTGARRLAGRRRVRGR